MIELARTRAVWLKSKKVAIETRDARNLADLLEGTAPAVVGLLKSSSSKCFEQMLSRPRPSAFLMLQASSQMLLWGLPSAGTLW